MHSCPQISHPLPLGERFSPLALLSRTRQSPGAVLSKLRMAGYRQIPNLDADSKKENTKQQDKITNKEGR